MERIQTAQATASLVAPQSAGSNGLVTLSETRLDAASKEQVGSLLSQMGAGFPAQEQHPDTAEIFQYGMEILAAEFGLAKVQVALEKFLTRQKFFPHPSEVREELEAMAEKERMANRYQPDPACAHNRQRPPLQAGYVWVTDQEGTRVTGRCNCWLMHNGKPPRPEARPPAEDRKEAAAGVSA
jgi:hypothetical protein